MPLEKLGPYKLERLLGRGGMGAVYVGRHEQTGEQAAVKVLAGHLADDAAFRERFKREIETLKRLLHPNIVQLFGYGEDAGHLFYVMELVPGKSLQEELAAGRRFTWREAARIGIAVAQALKHAHDRGIVHRDLKPANLLIDAHDHVKLADFGIARLYGGTHVTADGGVVGTADYMAPEQAEGKPVTSRCDLYALGSVLYTVLTGKPPFAGRSVLEVMSALRKEKPTPVRRLAPETPEEFERIIGQLLEKDPALRIPTARAVINRLQAMEHALSLETRAGDVPPHANQLVPEAGHDLPPSEKTPATDVSSLATRPIEEADPTAGYQFVHQVPTEAASGGAGTHAWPQASAAAETWSSRNRQPDAGLAPPSTARPGTRFTPVSQEELRGWRMTEETPLWQWLAAAALVAAALALIAALLYWATRPPSADGLYAAVVRAAEEGGADSLPAVEGELARFLALYPNDPRAAQMQAYRQELERYRLERRLETHVRRGGVEGLSPPERAYLEAMQLRTTDPEQALTRLEALLAVYGGSSEHAQVPTAPAGDGKQDETEQCLELARRQAELLRASVARINDQQRKAVRRQLERAAAVRRTDPAAAAKIWQGIVTLYRDKPWAKDLVEEAKRALQAEIDKGSD